MNTHQHSTQLTVFSRPFGWLTRFLLGILCAGALSAHAANGIWTNNASSAWSATTNWLNSTVADGTDAIADFTTIDLAAPRTVTVDASHNLGSMLFGDAAGSLADLWTLTPSGGSVLTLAVSSGSPGITVSNNATHTNITVLNVPLAGTQGLTKAGVGTLVLGGNNSYSGATAISAGTLQLTNAASTGPVLYLSFNNVSGNIVTNAGSGGAAMNGLIVGTGASVGAGGPNGNNALTVGSGSVNAGYVLVNSSVVNFNTNLNWTLALWLKTSQTGAVYAYQGDGGWASGNTVFHLNAGSNDLAGAYAGGVRFAQGWQAGTSNLVDSAWHFVVMTCSGGGKTNYVDGSVDSWTVINGAAMNQWNGNGNGGQFWVGGAPDIGDGDLRLNGQLAEVYVYNRALAQTEIQALKTAAGPVAQPVLPPVSAVAVASSSKLDLNGVSPAVAGLSGLGVVDTTASTGTNQLVINNSADTVFAGIITNTLGVLALHKTGAGALTLTGTNGYTGNTLLDSGTLNIVTANSIGTGGTLFINGGTIDNNSGAAVTIVNNKASQWAGDFTFTGTTNLSFGTGGVTITGPGTNRTVTVSSNTLSIGVLTGTTGPGYNLIKNGAGSLFLGGSSASTLAGHGLVINGGTVLMSQDLNSVASLTGTGTLETSGTGVNKWFWINNPSNVVFSGTIQNYPGTTGRGLGFNKTGLGTVTLNGNASFNDTITIQQGKVIMTGSGISIVSSNGSEAASTIGTVANTAGILSVSNGATVTFASTGAAAYTTGVTIGSTALANGDVQVDAGSVIVSNQLAVGGACYGAYSQRSGSTLVGGFIACGGNTNGGVINLSGGTLTHGVGYTGMGITIGYGGVNAATYGVMNVYNNASYTVSGAANGIWPGEVNNGNFNMWGNPTVTVNSDGIVFGRGNAAGNGTVNLNGGTLAVNFITNGVGSGTFNFNGGTLKANAQIGTSFTKGNTSTAFFDYSGGTIIDDGGYAIAFTQPIQAPGGYGISSIPIISGGSNYIDTPIIVVNGGSGSGAKAISQIDYGAGSVTNILITCPGNNYSSGDALTFTIAGGAGSGLTLGTPTFGANAAGSLTKLGAGSLTLVSGNGFAGLTKILGGTLNVNSSTLSTPTDLLVTNSTLAIDASAGSGFSAGNVTLQNNTTVSISFGNLTSNPNFAALSASGSLSAPGTGLIIAVNGLGLRPGTFTLIKYTGTALASLANFSLTLPPGVAATLVNNQGNDSIDLNITTSPQNLTWEGTAGVNWDINTTANWKDGNGNGAWYLQYTNGAVIVGDATTFDDTLTNDFVNPQPTNINFTTTVQSFPVVVNSTLPYSFGGVGSLAGSGYLVMSNTGSLFIGLSNSYSGGTFVSAGTIIITNDSALGAGSGLLTMNGGTLQANSSVTNNRPISVAAASTLDLPTNVTMQINGVATGSGTWTKLDAGTLVLTGTMSNAPAVAAGTMRVASTGKVATTGVLRVGNTASSSGVLTISGGTIQGNNNGGQFVSSVIAGSAAGSAGSIQMASGTLTTLQQFALGAGLAGYGAFDVGGGTVGLGSYLVVGFNNDTAVLNQTGGTISVLTNCLTIGAGGTASVGVANFSAGTFVSANGTNGNSGGRGGAFVGENGTGFMNVMGSAALTLIGDANLTLGRTGTGAAGTVNLDGGTVTTAQVSQGAGSATLNFNGGTLKASTNNANFVTGLTSATIYSGGATLNDGGFSVTIGQLLAAPSGYGVSSIPVSAGGSGYIDSPVVTISGGSGTNATAIAQINYSTGAVTNIFVTCPGNGYANGDSLSVSFAGGAGTGATAGTVALTANTGGSLTKLGAGTLTLSGANTYSGTTLVGGGQLMLTPAQQVTGSVTVSNGATLGVLIGNGGTANAGNLNLGTSATGTNYLSFILNAGTNPVVPPLQVGTITSSGTNYVRLGGIISLGTFPVVKYSGALAGSGVFATNVLGPQGMVATLSNNVASGTLYVTVAATAGLVWTGTNTGTGLVNLWNAGVTNWLAAGVAAAYTEPTAPGDAVLFNDLGSGTVVDSNTVSPANVVISNNAVSYTFQGPGHIAGTTGLTKLGSGTATINLTGNTYTGNTVISGGTLQIGSVTAIPSGIGAGNVAVNAAGTLDLNGLSPTINGLSGSGTINNSSATASVLTLGSNAPSINWAGTINNTGSAGSSIIKIGTNSMVVTGPNYLASTAASEINGGALLITNGGALYMTGGAEFWVMQNAGTASVTVDGGALVTSNNWLVVGRNNVAAIGTLTVNHGLVQKAGANNIVVGSLGANGTLTVNGGQVLNNGNLWLGENTGANAVLNLNGGLVQATQVRINGTTPASSIANFNGGTLQATAGNTNFFVGVTVNVLAGGFIFDDGGFALTNATQPWLDGDGLGGGLIKKGAGTLYLDTANTYTGTTLVTNGTLAGIGSVIGPMVVSPAGILGAGDAGGVGSFTVNNNLTLQGNAALRINKTGGTPAQDNVIVTGNINYGGVLTVTNITADATPLTTSDTFQLFSVTGSKSGNFTGIVGSPGPGLAFNFTPASGVLSIVTGIASNPTNITASVTGSTLTLTWPADHIGWILQAQTNALSTGLTAPAGTWFDVAGSGAATSAVITINPAEPTVFYRLRHP